jgi:hypothetical protein
MKSPAQKAEFRLKIRVGLEIQLLDNAECETVRLEHACLSLQSHVVLKSVGGAAVFRGLKSERAGSFSLNLQFRGGLIPARAEDADKCTANDTEQENKNDSCAAAAEHGPQIPNGEFLFNVAAARKKKRPGGASQLII